MFEEPRQLTPLIGKKRTVMKVVIAGYFLVAIGWFVEAAVNGSSLRGVFGVIVLFLAFGQLWDFRRRTAPGGQPREPRRGRRAPTRRSAPARRVDRRDRSR